MKHARARFTWPDQVNEYVQYHAVPLAGLRAALALAGVESEVRFEGTITPVLAVGLPWNDGLSNSTRQVLVASPLANDEMSGRKHWAIYIWDEEQQDSVQDEEVGTDSNILEVAVTAIALVNSR